MALNLNTPGAWHHRLFPQSIQSRFLLLLFLIFVPIMVAETIVYLDRFEVSKTRQMTSNLELARSLVKTFDAFLKDIRHQQLSIGIALSSPRALTPEQVQKLLEESKREHSVIRDLHWMNPDGRVIATTQPEALGFDGSDRPYVQRIVAGAKWYVSDLYQSRTRHDVVFSISRGILDPQGTLLGIVVTTIRPEGLRDVLAVERFDEGAVLIVDQQGGAVYRYPEKEWTWETRGLPAQSPIVKEGLAGREIMGSALNIVDQGQHFVSASPIASIGWLVVVTISRDDALEPIFAALNHHACMFLLALAFSLGAILVMAKRTFVAPLVKLREQAMALGRGDSQPADLDSNGPTELKDLARTLNVLVSSLQHQKQELEIIIESMADGLILYNPQGMIVRMNAVAQALMSYTGEEHALALKERLSRHTMKTEEGRDLDWEDHPIAKALRGEIIKDEVLQVHSQGQGGMIWISTSAVPIIASHGELMGAVLTIQDITARKQMEEELRRSEALLRKVLETLPVGVWIADADGKIVMGNPAAQQIWGGKRYVDVERYSEYKGWRLDTGHPIEADEWALARSVRRGETSLDEEVEIQCFDGSRKIILNSAVPVRDEQGKILASIAINQDITERRQAELERQRLEARLRQAQKVEALGTLAGGIAHDFNNILAVILGHAELMLQGHLSASQRSQVEQMIKAALRARDLVKQILIFSRQQGDQALKILELAPLIEEAVRFLRSLLPTTVEIRTELHTPSGWVIADSTQLHQIVVNLAINGAQAMAECGGTLTIGLEEVDVGGSDGPPELTPGTYVRLRVSDAGCGIETTMLDKIFDPYFTTKAVGQGSGLGLAVVQGIVKRHHGTITVHSAPGRGSTFDVYLPKAQGPASSMLLQQEEPLPTGRGELILIVDDEPVLVELGKSLLEHLGYTVEATTSSREALERFRRSPERFALIVTDYTMPELTGAELAQAVHELNPRIPILLTSGFNEQLQERRLQQAGITRFLMKPLGLRDFAHAVREMLKEARS